MLFIVLVMEPKSMFGMIIWLFLGPLSQFITKRDIFEDGLSIGCRVWDVLENGEWKWPQVWRTRFPFLFHIPPPLLFHARKDKVVWKSNDGKIGHLSVKTAWSDLADSKPTISCLV